MSSLANVAVILAIVSAVCLIAVLIRRSIGGASRLFRPLLAGALFINGIGLVLAVVHRFAESAALSMAADMAIFLFKFGWLFCFLAFLRRFALPLGKRPFRRIITILVVPGILLLSVGGFEFLSGSGRAIFDNLQYLSDFLIFLAMIGAGYYLRSRTAVFATREAAKAMVVLGGLSISIFLALGLWWIIGGSLYRTSPAVGTVFMAMAGLAFNVGLTVWIIRFRTILSSPENARFEAGLIPGSLALRWGVTRREREIIELVGLGLSNQDIADRLFISVSTVKKHLNNIFTKTGVSNRVQLLRTFSETTHTSMSPIRSPRGR